MTCLLNAGDPPGSRQVYDSFTTSSRHVHDKFTTKNRSRWISFNSVCDTFTTCSRLVHDSFTTDTTRSRQLSWTCRERVVNLSGTRWITRISSIWNIAFHTSSRSFCASRNPGKLFTVCSAATDWSFLQLRELTERRFRPTVLTDKILLISRFVLNRIY
jgi:hypothetical protein